MSRLVIASMRKSAGKTSMIVGLGSALKKKIGYLKPFGDRLLYRKKRLWDYDAGLIAGIFGIAEGPESMSIGFDHSKLRFMYDEASTREKLGELAETGAREKDLLLIEAGKNIAYGGSVHLDALSLARNANARLILIVSGDDGLVLDDLTQIRTHLDLEGVDFGGAILNKIKDPQEFQETYGDWLKECGFPILGLVPHEPDLTTLSMRYLADSLFAKIIAGETGMDRIVRNIFVGAMSSDAAMRNPFFTEKAKLVITSGDRSDMILTALESDTAGILLTNNIYPPQNIIAHAEKQGTPLLLATMDTYQVARQIELLERLLTAQDAEKIKRLEELVTAHINLEGLKL